MVEFLAQFTNDGSVGLFNEDVNDIYHSSYGALSEAYEKFILPSDIINFLKNNSEIKILDICFGIGYNSKAFLNFFIKIFRDKNKYIKSIYTDNILCEKKFHVTIHGVDIDKKLISISPFIKQNKKNNIKNKNYYITDDVNYILLNKLYENFSEEYVNNNLNEFLANKAHKKFFSSKMVNYALFYKNEVYKTSLMTLLQALLHNIYYQYISISYKNSQKVLKNNKIDIGLYPVDARTFIQTCDIVYDFIFLDAFSPLKAPSLWTVEFFEKLYNHSSENCMILTYSNSAAIRNAFLQNNFYVGKIYNKSENKFTGTIASKNKSLIKIPLDEFDMGLINTKAGICFHDENFSLTNEEILFNRKLEAEKSDLISASKYKKENKCNTMQ